LNIYVYGASKFKKSMFAILEQANLNEISSDLESIDDLEDSIQNNPNDIYLIDSDKIINRNIITDKLNFLKPQGSVYKEYLDEVGIDDMCFNSNEALVNYIIDKIDSADTQDYVTDEKSNSDIQEDVIPDEEDIENIIEERDMNDILEIDDIFESEIIDALGVDINNIEPNNTTASNEIKIKEEIPDIKKTNSAEVKENNVQIDTSNVNDVMSLIQQLLNNKTLELSIKIKD